MFQRSLPPSRPQDDWPAGRVTDYKLFTSVLVNSGYRLYELVAGEKTFFVWAKPRQFREDWKLKQGRQVLEPVDVHIEYEMPDLSALMSGEVWPARDREVRASDFIMLDEKDGGKIVSGYDRHRE